MSFYLYILRSDKDGGLYTGSTGDLRRRLADHARGKVRSTAARRPLVLVYSEQFDSKEDTAARERYFKTPEGGVLKRKLIAEADRVK